MLASTYGSGLYNGGNYNGVVAGAAASPSPTPVPVIAFGPITLPVTGASLAVLGMVAIAAAAGLIVWAVMHSRAKAR